MAVKNKKKAEESTTADLLESSEALAEQFSKTEDFIDKNQGLVFGILGVLVLAVAGYFGYSWYNKNQNEQAQNEMFQAVYYFESDSLDLALNGDGNNLGFVQITEDYGSTAAGNLANFYAGAAHLKKGNFELAQLYLKEFKASDLLIQGRAYSLIGDTYMEMDKYKEAADYYKKAVDYKPNEQFTPQYLMKLALANEKLKDTAAASEAYDMIIDKYKQSSEFQKAKKYRASLN